MKRYVRALSALLLLAGCRAQPPAPTPTPEPATVETFCSTPTPDPTHEPVNIEVDVGDGEHTFWVEPVRPGEPGEVQVNIYQQKNDSQLFQCFAEWSPDYEIIGLMAEDVNFDGYMDFQVHLVTGTWGGQWSAYYIWNAEQEQFVRDPYGLEDLPLPKFDPEKQIIETWSHSASNYTIEFYRYLDGKLTCVRRLRNRENYTDDFTATLTVEEYDRETGALEEVYREEQAEIGGVTYATTDEFRRWHDIDYPGE